MDAAPAGPRHHLGEVLLYVGSCTARLLVVMLIPASWLVDAFFFFRRGGDIGGDRRAVRAAPCPGLGVEKHGRMDWRHSSVPFGECT
jgi:hypothetical protein